MCDFWKLWRQTVPPLVSAQTHILFNRTMSTNWRMCKYGWTTSASVSSVWSIYTGALWNMTVGLHLFGAHLWHFYFHYSHIVRVIGREQPTICWIIRQWWYQDARKSAVLEMPSGRDSFPSVVQVHLFLFKMFGDISEVWSWLKRVI